ncbi:MAG: Bug family tripartite tricarboxylate transporter substrate binding protein [Acetobacteraceae bacterium]
MLRRRDLALAMPGLMLSGTALSQPVPGFPARPMRLVIPFTPGGTNDLVGRLIAERMAARLGQPMVVENRGGAGGVIGNDLVAKAAPDGHTMLLAGSGSFVISSLVQPTLPYDPERDFSPVGFIGGSAGVIAINPRHPVNNLNELREYARRPDVRLTFATPGVGTNGHAVGAMLAVAIGAEIEFIHYRGTGPATADLIAGRVDLLSNAPAPLAPHFQSGAMRPLAVAGTRRSAVVPDVTTSVEQGFPELQASTWFAILTPGGTPRPIRGALHAALNAVLAEPDVQSRFAAAAIDIEPSASPEAFAAFLAEDRARWARVVQAANLRAG